ADTWAEGDYIAEVWDAWMADSKGRFLVAEVEGSPVGVGHLAMLSPTEGWLEGIRVAPDARQHGVGTALMRALAPEGRDRGADVRRVFTEKENSGAQALFARLGFALYAEVIHYHGRPLARPAGEPERVRRATHVDEPSLWSWLEHSMLTPFNGGL